MILDPSAGAQSYIEDCEICCQPIEIQYQVSEAEVESLKIKKAD